jgi:hypothetical protein
VKALTHRDMARFWAKVDKGGPEECWLWTGERNHRGYGRVYSEGTTSTTSAHRVSLRIATGNPGADLLVLHSCDNPPCVNPAHLRYGTHEENMIDMSSRGRADDRKGSANTQAKLTEEDVPEIRARLRAGESLRSAARDYNVSPSTILDLKKGRTWAHVLEEAA